MDKLDKDLKQLANEDMEIVPEYVENRINLALKNLPDKVCLSEMEKLSESFIDSSKLKYSNKAKKTNKKLSPIFSILGEGIGAVIFILVLVLVPITVKHFTNNNQTSINSNKEANSKIELQEFSSTKYGFSVSFPKTWNGVDEGSYFTIKLDDSKKDVIFMTGAEAKKNTLDQGETKQQIKTDDGSKGIIYIKESDGIIVLKAVIGDKVDNGPGLELTINKADYEKNKDNIMNLIKSIKILRVEDNTNTDKNKSNIEWKNYSSEKYGFSFSYPSTWTIKDDEGWYSIITDDSKKDVIFMSGAEGKKTVLDQGETQEKITTNDGSNGVIYIKESNGTISLKAVIGDNAESGPGIDLTMNKTDYGNNKDIIMNLLKSIKILNTDNKSNTDKNKSKVEWKSYLSEKYGFSFLYPSTWTVKDDGSWYSIITDDSKKDVIFMSGADAKKTVLDQGETEENMTTNDGINVDVYVKESNGTLRMKAVVDDKVGSGVGIEFSMSKEDYNNNCDKIIGLIKNIQIINTENKSSNNNNTNVEFQSYTNAQHEYMFSCPSTWTVKDDGSWYSVIINDSKKDVMFIDGASSKKTTLDTGETQEQIQTNDGVNGVLYKKESDGTVMLQAVIADKAASGPGISLTINKTDYDNNKDLIMKVIKSVKFINNN